MKPTALTLSTFLIALAGSAAALAQTAPSTPPGAASVLPQGTESTAPATTPLSDAVAEEAPLSRGEVIDETLEARRAGEIPTGEAAITESAPMGEPIESAEAAPMLSDTRAETVQETQAAREAGEIPQGEAAVPIKP